METPAQFKTCTGCHQTFPATSLYFHRQVNGKFGVTSKCKSCKKKQIDDWTMRNQDKRREQKIRWKKKNYDKYLQIKRDDERRRRTGSVGKINYVDWIEMLDKYDNKCLKCGATGDITQDHVIPLVLGGRNTIDNIQPLCRTCNSTKGTKIIDYRKML